MIECKGIYKKYKTSGIILSDVQLKVEEGEFVSIIGRSGCGKTTLLNIIGLLDEPSRGEVVIDNYSVDYSNVKQRDRIRRDKIAYITQFPRLLGEYTLAQNIALPLNYRHINNKDVLKKVSQVCEYLNLSNHMNDLCKDLSGGEQQRTTIARALVTNPHIILADEPTGSVDPTTEAAIVEILKEQAKNGVSVVMVTHNLELTRFCDCVYHICDGKLEYRR